MCLLLDFYQKSDLTSSLTSSLCTDEHFPLSSVSLLVVDAAATGCVTRQKQQVLTVTLTEVVGDVIRDVDVPIGPFAPHAAVAGAGVSVFLCISVDGDVSLDQDGLIIRTDCKKPHPRHLHTHTHTWPAVKDKHQS